MTRPRGPSGPGRLLENGEKGSKILRDGRQHKPPWIHRRRPKDGQPEPTLSRTLLHGHAFQKRPRARACSGLPGRCSKPTMGAQLTTAVSGAQHSPLESGLLSPCFHLDWPR